MRRRSTLRARIAAGGCCCALLTLVALPLAPTPARADCFLSGSTITCTAPGTGGYSDGGGDNLTLTVQPGTTVVDDGFSAILLRNRNTITNNGTITAGDAAAGIFVSDNNTIRNNGIITAGADGAGIVGNDGNSIINAGSITIGDGFGGFGIASGFDNTITNSGTITVGQGATAIAASANSILPSFNSVTNSGGIQVGAFGIGIEVTGNHRVLNSGTIVGGQFVTGIIGEGSHNIVTNTGTIAVGNTGTGVQFFDDSNTLYNYGAIKAFGNGFSIEACGCSATNNNFKNMSGGTLDGYFSIDGSGNTVSNSGLITITDPTAPLIGYPTFLIANTNLSGAGNSFVQTSTGTLALRMNSAGTIDNLSADSITAHGTLKVVIQPQLFQNTSLSNTAVGLTPYGALTLGNTITSGFDHYDASSPFFAVTPIYDTGNASSYTGLSVQLDRIPFGSVPGASTNQRAVGDALEPGYSPNLDPSSARGQFYINLLMASSVNVLDQLSGAGTAAAQGAAFGATGLFSDTTMQQGLAWLTGTGDGGGFGAPLGYATAAKPDDRPGYDAFAAMRPRPPEPPVWRAWALGFGSTRSIDGDSSLGTADQSLQTAGGAMGVERAYGGDLLLGFAAGGSGSRFSTPSLSTSGTVDGGHIGAYAVTRWGDIYAAATLNYARFDNRTDRTITGIGPTETAHGSFVSDELGGRFEIGWRRRIASYRVTPFVAIEPAALWQHAYSETSTTAAGGAGMLGLSYAARETTSLPTFLGAQLDTEYRVGGNIVRPFVRAAWVHEFRPQRQVEATFITIPAASFTVDGARPASDAARISGGATWSIDASKALFARVDTEFSGSGAMVAGTAGARMTW